MKCSQNSNIFIHENPFWKCRLRIDGHLFFGVNVLTKNVSYTYVYRHWFDRWANGVGLAANKHDLLISIYIQHKL